MQTSVERVLLENIAVTRVKERPGFQTRSSALLLFDRELTEISPERARGVEAILH
jgi:hypothetical protein